ncbi:MAG: IS21 family transposase [Deltaproteobacteria bacterium]|nr:IS21 family transposase [Deltaproteobacteria bacterium]
MSNDEAVVKKILYLREVKKLSLRQISKEIGFDRKKVARLLNRAGSSIKQLPKPGVLEPFRQLITEWYKERPYLKALQIYEWLQSYGYRGSYPTVVEFTQKYRKKRKPVYHPLTFLPGQEAQVDWFFFNHEIIGKVAGFLYVLSYSRYAWGHFYPRTTFEFFLDGHLKCFEHLGGLAHSHRYDNLKSVVLRRHPAIEYNPQFLDFARHYGFSIYLCQPGQGNQKGRVERPIRDIRTFLYAGDFRDIDDLNHDFHAWLDKRNQRVHRSTDKPPKEMLSSERLIRLPINSYSPTRTIPGVIISKTALVDFETNKYSVPSAWGNKTGEIVAFPRKIEIWVGNKKVAAHQRCFERRKTIENPLHTEQLLKKTSPQFKMQRVFQLIRAMAPAFQCFLDHQEDDTQRQQAAYCLFRLLKSHSRPMLLSAIRELNAMKCFKLKALKSLLHLPQSRQGDSLWPQKSDLLNLDYEQRSLDDYDGLA